MYDTDVENMPMFHMLKEKKIKSFGESLKFE